MSISTHDLTKRSTSRIGSPLESSKYFNSRPHEEVDNSERSVKTSVKKFQLTTSRRGRPNMSSHIRSMRSFQLTTSRRGRHISIIFHINDTYFNSRPHEEVDRKFNAVLYIQNYFNSRPHEEVDSNFIQHYVI